ncbi:MAG: Uma2 family endonuclease, partial [Symploca sp. SIO2E6]|nr:Uma2 family endonuclease [Symploca sp. SIO2E6]
MVQLQPSQSRQKSLPTMYDLPSEDPEEPGLVDEFHDVQPNLLKNTCQSPNYSPIDYFSAKDLNLYYDPEHLQWYKRPDWFLALGAQRSTNQQELRLSYVMWQEVVAPFLVVELLSPGTEDEDLGLTERKKEKPPTKWEVYEKILQVPYYVIYDRYEN